MMEALRRSASGWIAKLLIGLLVLSFAVWGVADIFTGYRGDDVATVGKTEITVEDYRAALQREIQQVSRQYGTYLTMDQARSIGLDGRVLGQLMAEAALNDEARARGLGLSDTAVADSILADPSFQLPGGQFDRNYFQQLLSSIGYTEEMYVAEQRQRMLRQLIADAVGGGVKAPEVLERAIDRYTRESRSAEYLVVTAGMAEPVAEPTEEELRTFFDENAAMFRIPELRRVTLLVAEPDSIAETIEVSEQDIRDSYDSDPGRFGTPELRTIERIVFPDRAAAEAARSAIEGGATFEEVATEAGVSETDRELGQMSREEVLDAAIGDAAFSLDQGVVSDVVDGSFGPALVRVTEIEPGDQPTFEQVREAIREEIAVRRASDGILDLYDTIEDDRAAGMTFEEIGAKHSLEVISVEGIDREGRDSEGNPVADLPSAQDLVTQIFQTDAGIEADPVETPLGGFVWFGVQDVIAARDRTFEEARERIEEAWRADRTDEAVAARARELADRIEAGAGFFEVASELDTTASLVGPLTRTGSDGAFGSTAVQLMFTTPEGAVAQSVAENGTDRVVFRVTEVTIPEFTPDASNAQAVAQISDGISNDVIDQYLQQLEATLGSSVNRQALMLALGEVPEE